MAFSDLPGITRTKSNNLILKDLGNDNRHLEFTIAQLCKFAKFDKAIQQGKLTCAGKTVPGGYVEFQTIWTKATTSAYQFSEYDTETGSNTVHGQPLPIDELAPLPDLPNKTKPAPTQASTPAPAKRPSSAAQPSSEPPITGLFANPAFAPIVKTLVVNQLSRSMKVPNKNTHPPKKVGRTTSQSSSSTSGSSKRPLPDADSAASTSTATKKAKPAANKVDKPVPSKGKGIDEKEKPQSVVGEKKGGEGSVTYDLELANKPLIDFTDIDVQMKSQ
ncbi:hypothetical protein V8D89_008486 [Ganoderma adspersum]